MSAPKEFLAHNVYYDKLSRKRTPQGLARIFLGEFPNTQLLFPGSPGRLA